MHLVVEQIGAMALMISIIAYAGYKLHTDTTPPDPYDNYDQLK